MPQYTMTVFQWSGTGYNATYNESHTAVFNDDDASVGGSSDSNETVSIDGGSANVTGGSPYKISINFRDTDNNKHVEDFNFFYTPDGGWYFAPQEGSAFTEGARLGRYQSHSTGWDYDEVVCFAAGTLIRTKKGDIAVEDLIAGDQVLTHNGHARRLVMNMRRELQATHLADNPKLRPIRIVAGALGGGLPKRDLLVSRQHRMLVQSRIAERMFGTSETLVSAIRLTALPGIFVDTEAESVAYHHLLFDQHEVIFAEGAPSESLLTGAEALKTISPDAREEILALFPEIGAMAEAAPARVIATPRNQRRLVARHKRNNQPLLPI
ncbi:Hint domain-containing protein [Cognatishimia sp. SS12]|uniref:Hint domain-containing protein n=1 Tax=Cognatishimia sp. SS12 TaxID=2979465 RepID=UPI00232EC81F|nr:Hint domain-containing protein [Cognatishimia sp. SS12]MDC0736813.1 Hint domain-containing protein [Cognatishimia sp. SS12]